MMADAPSFPPEDSQSPQVDTILVRGIVRTFDDACPVASALAIRGDSIVAVGDDATIGALATASTRRVDLAGAVVLPGFNDAHVHLWKMGMLLTQVNARPAVVPSINDLIKAFADRAAQTPAGTWIEGRGYDETRLSERRHPTRADLDVAAPAHPVVLGRTCGHVLVANSCALRLAGIGVGTPDPAGGQIERDVDGEPSGVLRETAMALVRAVQPAPSAGELAHALVEAARLCLPLGITSIGEPGVDPRTLAIYQQLDAAGHLPLRCDVMAMTLLPNGERVPVPQLWYGQRVKVDTVKLFADGGLSSGTAALSIPYRGRHDCGLPRFPIEQLIDEVCQIYGAGVCVAVHAIGDQAIGDVLDAFAACRRSDSVDRIGLTPRLRIEHCGLPNSTHLARARSLGVGIATQPAFLYDLGDAFLHHLPDALVPQCYPFAAMLSAGLSVAFSSDGPVIGDINPLLGLQAAALRQTRTGCVIAPAQEISIAQALRCFTIGSAIVSGMGQRLGRLAPGYFADCVVLSDDPFRVPVERLLEIQVEQTYVGGDLVYAA